MVKLVAYSYERYRASATERRLHGGKTVTRFYVFQPSDKDSPANWAKVETCAPTPGERKTLAIARGRAELVKRGIIPA